MTPLLAVRGLTVALPARGARGARLPVAGSRAPRRAEHDPLVPVVRDLSFDIAAGELTALVGESGAGKSLTALALMGLLPAAAVVGGAVTVDGEPLVGASPARWRRLRGRTLAMVFQEPMTALDPSYTVGFQITEVLRAQGKAGSRRQARRRATELLERVSMPDPEQRLRAYPHQLSGGQRQRVVLAMALAGEPRLLIADEPTTALDVTVQAEILELLARLRDDLGLSVLLITHDLGVVAQLCDRALVMYAGELVEEAAVEALFAAPAHPYTRALLAATPGSVLQRSLTGRQAWRVGEPLPTIPGQVPEPWALPAGCPFHPRCSERFEPCDRDPPRLEALADASPPTAGHGPAGSRRVRCWLHSEPAHQPSAVGEG